MNHQTAAEAKAIYVAKMGDELGEQFAELWQEVVYLHRKWSEYVILFGTKPERLKILNQSAPVFFRMMQDVLWEETLLHIACITDRSATGGKKNLTLQNYPALTNDQALKDKLAPLLEEITAKSEFCRDWRNRRIAHRDLAVALDKPAKPLENGSRTQVNELLELIAKTMNAVQLHYMDGTTHYTASGSLGGALALLYHVDDGVKIEAQRNERRMSGNIIDGDYTPRDL